MKKTERERDWSLATAFKEREFKLGFICKGLKNGTLKTVWNKKPEAS